MIFVRNVYELLRRSSFCDWAVMGSGGQRDRGAVTCRHHNPSHSQPSSLYNIWYSSVFYLLVREE